jgi:parallel beta-helix repeat protein
MTWSKFAIAPSILLLAGSAFAGGTVNVPGDFATIQEAIDAAAGGDFTVITVGKGIFRENLVITTEGLTLKGKGNATVVDGAYLGTCLDVQANDVTINGITFANGGPAADKDMSEGGGLLYTGSGATIVRCEFQACASWGIKLVGSGVIQDNLVVATLGPGMVLDSGDTAGALTTVRHNEVIRNASGILADDGPFLIEKNLIRANMGDGIHMTILAATSNGVATDPTVVGKNDVQDNIGTGLLLVDEIGSTTLIEKNSLDGNGVALDLTASDLTVSKNDIDLSLTAGAFLHTTGMTFEKNKMRRSNLVGIVVQTAPGATDGSNTFVKNEFQSSGGDGVIVESSLNVFEDNLITDNFGDGLSIVGGASGNKLVDNMVKDNGHDGLDNSGLDTLVTDNASNGNLGADLAGIGDGTGTVDPASAGNLVADESGLDAEQELELDTLP